MAPTSFVKLFVINGRLYADSCNGGWSRGILNFYNLFITLPGLNEQLSLVKKLQRAKVETWQGGHSAVLGGGTTLTASQLVYDQARFLRRLALWVLGFPSCTPAPRRWQITLEVPVALGNVNPSPILKQSRPYAPRPRTSNQ